MYALELKSTRCEGGADRYYNKNVNLVALNKKKTDNFMHICLMITNVYITVVYVFQSQEKQLNISPYCFAVTYLYI